MNDAAMDMWINFTHLKFRTYGTIFSGPPGDGMCRQSVLAAELLASAARFDPVIWGLQGQHACYQPHQ